MATPIASKRFNAVKQNLSNRIPELLVLAAEVSLPTDNNDPRSFLLGAIGIRTDGVLVSAKNGAVFSTTADNYQRIPGSHAEGRVLRKIGRGGIIYVSRVSKRDFTLACSKPCAICSNRLYGRSIEKVFYTIDNFHYGVFYPMRKRNTDEIFRV